MDELSTGQESGWQVRKGEKAATIFFYKPLEVDDAEVKDGIRTIPILKQYAVFHASQVDGLSAYVAPAFAEAPWKRPEASDLILRNSGAELRTGGRRAFYSPTTDHIQLPGRTPSMDRMNGRPWPCISSAIGPNTRRVLIAIYPAALARLPMPWRSIMASLSSSRRKTGWAPRAGSSSIALQSSAMALGSEDTMFCIGRCAAKAGLCCMMRLTIGRSHRSKRSATRSALRFVPALRDSFPPASNRR